MLGHLKELRCIHGNSDIFKANEVLVQNVLLKSKVQVKPFTNVRGAGLEREDEAFGIDEEAIH